MLESRTDNPPTNVGFLFRARPLFAHVAEGTANSNIAQFFNRSSDNQESNHYSNGFQQLGELVQSPDKATRRWAALAFLQIACCDAPLDPFRNRRPPLVSTKGSKDGEKLKVDPQPATKIAETSAGKVVSGRDQLYHQSGMIVASKLAYDSDPVLRRVGCLALSRFVQCKEANVDMVSENAWKALMSVCSVAINGVSTLDVDGK